MSVSKTVLLKENNIFVVKLNLNTGDKIPTHHSKAYVTASVVSGEGIFTVEDKEYSLDKGIFVTMKPFENHSILAKSDLEIVVHHIMLPTETKSITNEKICGA